MCRRAAQALRTAFASCAQARALRKESQVAVGWQRLLRVSCASREADPVFEWNDAALAELGVDKEAARAAVEAHGGSDASASVAWSL